VDKGVNRKIAVWLGWKWNAPPKRQTWDPYWSDETGMSVHPSRTFFTESDMAAITLLPVLVKRGYFPELYFSTDSEGFSAWYFTETPGQPYFLGQTIAAAITASVAVLAEAVRPWKGIRFRCIFCGKEHDTVEECNGCEESHYKGE
jgi:hypothetical protein